LTVHHWKTNPRAQVQNRDLGHPQAKEGKADPSAAQGQKTPLLLSGWQDFNAGGGIAVWWRPLKA